MTTTDVFGSLKDFFGHELRVGDIAATGALDEIELTMVRIEKFSPSEYVENYVDVTVKVLSDGVSGRAWYVGLNQLIWFTSEYVDVHPQYVFDLFR